LHKVGLGTKQKKEKHTLENCFENIETTTEGKKEKQMVLNKN